MKHTSTLIFSFSLLALLWSCGEPEPTPKPDGGGSEQVVLIARELESNQPIVSSVERGLSPLAMDFCYTSVLVGCVYESASAYPDLFICGSGGLTSSSGGRRGLNYCQFKGLDSRGRLIYSHPKAITTAPWDVTSAAVKIMKIGSEIYAIQTTKTKLNVARYNRETMSFGSEWTYSTKLTGVPYAVSTFDFVVSGEGVADLTIMCYTVASVSPDSDYTEDSLYDSAGFYMGTIPEGALYRTKILLDGFVQDGEVKQIGNDNSVILGPTTVAQVKGNDWSGYIVSNKAGALKYVPSAASLDVADYLVDTSGNQLINRSNVKRVSVINADRDGLSDDFITSGEGAMWLYRYSGRRNAYGTPIYHPAEVVLMQDGDLFSGSLTVPNVVDWDGDGALDVVTGNSEGRLMFFKNYGTNLHPVFAEGEYMKLWGEEFCIRAGYYELQGPMECCWGYLCPTVFDWNGDGLYDIVFSYNEGKYMYMPNVGTATNPVLGTPKTIYMDGMELYGVWRVRPAIERIGDRVAMMIMDGENALHLYWQTSDTSVTDGGKVELVDGKFITGHNNYDDGNVQHGRGKLNFVDWDSDGRLDLLVGTIKRSSFPSPERGLPDTRRKLGFTGMQVLYFHNEGTSAEPRYAYPVQFLVNGKDKPLGAHSNAPVGCMLGDVSDGPNLLVGVESGRFMFFDRKDLTYARLP